jgi:RNA polymerase sigma-32 factor
MVKIGKTQAQRMLFFNLKKDNDRLAARSVESTALLVAHYLNVRPMQWWDVQRWKLDISMDPPRDDGRATIGDSSRPPAFDG